MTPMNLSWLDDFLALAASGNFSRAADERHMTQPAFSRRIRALEEWVGTELFDRSSQPARLTDAGEWFRDTAEDLLARVARVPAEARAVAEGQAATLRFAATHALSFTFLPGWLRALESRVAIGPVRLVADVLQRCEAMLLHGEVQFVLSHAHPQAPGVLQAQGYPSLRVGDDRLVPVSAPDANGCPRHSLVANRAGQPVTLLSYGPESGMDRLLHEVLGPALARLPTHSAFATQLSSVLRTMALDGRGIAWLPHSLIAEDVTAGRLVEAGPREWSIPMEVRLHRDRAPLGKAGEDFWTAVCAAA